MNKLQYDGVWNARPRDRANVHAYLSHMLERKLNWQVVPVDVPMQQWQDAPVLLITGSRDPAFSDEQVGKLREFVQQGGLIFSITEGHQQAFSDAMEKYASQVVPESATASAKWRRLPPQHPLFAQLGPPDQMPEVMGISNGVRELWIHSETDLGAKWQAHDDRSKTAWDMPARLFMYVVGKDGFRSRLQSLAIAAPEARPSVRLRMARLRFDGNWNPEPVAWQRLARELALNSQVELTIEPCAVEDIAAKDAPVLAHLAGIGVLRLTEAQRQALRAYLERGGTLFIEAIGGDHDFTVSAHDVMATILRGTRLIPLPADAPLYAGGFSQKAAALGQVDFNKTWILNHGRSNKPRLEGIYLRGRLVVLFSGEDITHGLLGIDTAGFEGYAPASAIALARNIVLWASPKATP